MLKIILMYKKFRENLLLTISLTLKITYSKIKLLVRGLAIKQDC